MKMTIDRSLCDHALNECENCFARLILNPLGEDRHCVTEFVDDGDPHMVLTLMYDGRTEVLHLTPEDRAMVANLGWSQFVQIMPDFFRA
jgi:hypothetical protein